MNMTTSLDHTTFLTKLRVIIKGAQGSSRVAAANSLLDEYDAYFATTPIPTNVAKFVNAFIMLIDNCEGSELERELDTLKFPVIKKVAA